MGRRAAGIALIGIAAYLYVSAAPLILSILALIIGFIYLIAAEFGNPFAGGFEQIRKNWNEFPKDSWMADGSNTDANESNRDLNR